MQNKPSEIIDASFETISATPSSFGSNIADASLAILETGKSFTEEAGKFMSTTAELVGDLNGDGKVDIEDAKIAFEKVKELASTVGDESAKLCKEVMQSDLVKDVAPYAAIGAVIAIPIPIIGPALGAAIGAGLGLFKNATKKS